MSGREVLMRFLPLLLLFSLVWADDVRMDCHPEPGASQQNCEERNCIWQPPADRQATIPWCFMKKGIGYTNISTAGPNAGPKNPWGDDIQQIYFTSSTIGKTLNVKIYVPGRYEPPVNLPRNPSVSADSLQLATHNVDNTFSFTVLRKSSGRRLFDTSLGGLIFSDKFLQIATYLPSDAMYGWGENVHPTLKHNFTSYTTWGMLARDEPPSSAGLITKNLYGVHPFYMVIEPDGNAHGVLILNSNPQDLYPLAKDTKIMLGVVWPDRHVAFPDFLETSNNTADWWIDEFVRYWKQSPGHIQVPYDGIWIDMNEPANFGTNEATPWYFNNPDHPNDAALKCPMEDGGKDAEWDMPPFKTHSVYYYGQANLVRLLPVQGTYLASKTLCMLAVQANGTLRFYDVKNLYGWSEARATQQALFKATGKRGAVISSYIGSDICGFNGETNEELCLRWQQMGAFHPFMRNHNTEGATPQDPARWPSVTAAAIKANLFRYSYLPYLFSLHFIASMNGGTVARPLFYEYPKDQNTYDLGHQFLWGSSMLVAPVVYQNASYVHAYLPEDDWYSLFDSDYGQIINHGYQSLFAPWSSLIPVLVRGGSIIPRQKPNVTTEYTRKNAFELLVAPGAEFRAKDAADGFLYWDDGDSIVDSFATHDYYQWKFKYLSTDQTATLTIKTEHQAKSLAIPTLDTIEIFNYNHYPDYTSFLLNGKKINIDVQSSSYSPFTKILYISTKKLIDLSTGTLANLTWSHSKRIQPKRLYFAAALSMIWQKILFMPHK
ncbi:glycosyl hydrolase, family 31 [Ancylostoma ceylanicum]|uniref:Glycosyl hydrolase, family 31 n=1 Tax=Ancylostoma ceylanicum TaxID=53326 RepID=A0A0D6LFV3_9BILA|nr:glycosyl hydrolase, family 31 [Ancylostoma ceylanicum]